MSAKTIETEAYRIAEQVHAGALATDGDLWEECRSIASEIDTTADQLYYESARCFWREFGIA